MDDSIRPIERACRKLARLQRRDPSEPVPRAGSDQLLGDDAPLSDGDPRLWEDFVPQVCAVLEAIRQPSDSMLEAACRAWNNNVHNTLYHVAMVQWQAQIDALLAEPEEGRNLSALDQRLP